MNRDYSDATLLLIGHGSTVNRDSAGPVLQHAAELRSRSIFAEVLGAFFKQEPSLSSTLAAATGSRVFIVPLFISEGYFTEEIIPLELGFREEGQPAFARVQQRGERTLYYCAPVGTHESMTGVILARAREVLEKHPFPCLPRREETALFIAGHGTGRNENSRRSIERQVALIQALDAFAEVHAVFMEEEPRIADCRELTRKKNLVVVPFFISDGLHSCEDIPVLLGEPERVVRERLSHGQPGWRNPTEKEGKRVWYARAVGTDPHLADVIMERVRQAAGTT
ncbi:MAG: CbiX/SirB N-terminal domain-containing protein [Verrucomicrobiia bacterium]